MGEVKRESYHGMMNNGVISMLRVYELEYWLETGFRIVNYDRHFSKKLKEYFITEYNLVYNKKMRRYICDCDELFEIFKKKYPEKFDMYNIDTYNKLDYLESMATY